MILYFFSDITAMKQFRFKPFLSCAVLGAALATAACSVTEEYREVTAERIARPAFMVERDISAQNMDFQLWERMHQRGAPANVYIERDSGATDKEPSPGNPVAINLASRDRAKNLVYIARPCQYKESPDKSECDPKYWGARRYSPEVLAAYNEILDEIKARYSITEFNLIGYDGGANIVAGLAAQRPDVVSMRTVAGILNPDMVYTTGKNPQSFDADTLKANEIAPQLANMPQHHFIGAGDTVTPPAVYHSYRNAMGESGCVHYTFVPDADHEAGWVEKWPELLKGTVACDSDALKDYTPVELPPAPDYNPNK